MSRFVTRGRAAPILLRAILLFFTGAATPGVAQERTPPAAKVVPKPDTTLGDVRVDDYYWIRDDARKNPDVLAYLEAENAYTAAVMRHTEELQKTLYDEMLGRIKETDLSVPERVGRYFYYTRTEKGKQYPIHARKLGSLAAAEEVMLDENVLAAGKGYFRVGVTRVSPNDSLLAFTIDTTGGERHLLVVRDLATGRMLPDSIANVNYSVEWGKDNETLFYGMGDEANRAYKIFRHSLGRSGRDSLIFHEPNELFDVSLSTTRSRDYLLMSIGSFTSSEVHYLRADRPMGRFAVVRPRVPDVLYEVDHHGDQFLILTNEGATNFKLMKAPVSSPGRSSWRDLVPHRDSVLLDAIDVFRDYLVLYERRNALRQIRVMPFAGGESYYVDFPELVYTVRGSRNPDYDTKILRFNYTSMITPNSVYDFDMARRSRELKKR
ncbi:MAG: oligopeptidase B, partial [Gemmatimonadaceae bacterium]